VETLHAFRKMVTDLGGTTEGEDVTSQSLLRTPPLLKVTMNDKKVIITGFSHQ